jgi:hypothetical protein
MLPIYYIHCVLYLKSLSCTVLCTLRMRLIVKRKNFLLKNTTRITMCQDPDLYTLILIHIHMHTYARVHTHKHKLAHAGAIAEASLILGHCSARAD